MTLRGTIFRMTKHRLAIVGLASFCGVLLVQARATSAPPELLDLVGGAVVGGTVIDTNNFGHETHDIPDSVVILRGSRIERVGKRATTPIPHVARVLDCKSSFLLPGLVD